MNLTFSTGIYDRDGYLVDSGVFLHLNSGVILRFDDPDAIEAFAQDILGMLLEIRDNISV